MADVSKVGLGLPPYVFVVERVKIKEFAEAIGEKNPVFLSKEAALAEGYLDIPCPPTFITLALQEFTGAYLKAFEALGVSLKSVLHGEEEYEYLGEIYAGDRLTCDMHFAAVVEKKTKTGPMDLITLRTFFTNQDGKEVLRSKSLIIERK